MYLSKLYYSGTSENGYGFAFRLCFSQNLRKGGVRCLVLNKYFFERGAVASFFNGKRVCVGRLINDKHN